MKYTIIVDELNPLKEKYFEKTEFIKVEDISLEKETYSAYLELKKDYDIHITNKQNLNDLNSEYSTGLAFSIDKDIKDLYKYGFILRNNHLRYVGKIPAKIIYDYNLTLEEYVNEFGFILYINKPKNITSFDVVSIISKIFGIKRVGHTGTLDPLATGVMLVAVGKATKIVELLTANDKAYIASFELGYKTDTYDIEGKIIDKKPIPNNINMSNVLNSFKKTYLQEVPIYSAVKVNGKKLYEYAREEKEVELPKKEVTIKSVELLEENNNTYKFKTLVSKGTYIRSLINDIGNYLNTYATMTSLERVKQGLIKIEDTNTLEDIENNNYIIHSIEEVLDYPKIEVKDELLKNISNGVKVPNIWNIEDKVIFKSNNKVIGIYQKDGELLRTWKNFI